MKYRKRAEYADGRESSISGMEADDVYAPHEHLRKVGSRLVMMAPVIHQIVGDHHVWDRVAIAQYRRWSLRAAELTGDLIAVVPNPAKVAILKDGSGFHGPLPISQLESACR